MGLFGPNRPGRDRQEIPKGKAVMHWTMSAEPIGTLLLATTGDLMAEGDRSFAAAILGDSDCGILTQYLLWPLRLGK